MLHRYMHEDVKDTSVVGSLTFIQTFDRTLHLGRENNLMDIFPKPGGKADTDMDWLTWGQQAATKLLQLSDC